MNGQKRGRWIERVVWEEGNEVKINRESVREEGREGSRESVREEGREGSRKEK